MAREPQISATGRDFVVSQSVGRAQIAAGRSVRPLSHIDRAALTNPHLILPHGHAGIRTRRVYSLIVARKGRQTVAEFNRMLETEIPRLRRYARALCRDAAAADDLVQDCLCRALRKSHLFKPDTDCVRGFLRCCTIYT